MKKPPALRGFTLIEVLVALVVMATMAIMSWRGLDALVKSREITQTHLDQTTRLQTVMAQWEQDMRSLQDSNTDVPALFFDGASLRLTRLQPLGLQVVVWTARDGGLYRWEGATVQTVAALEESFQRSKQFLQQEGQQLRTLEDISGWQMYYSYSGATTWANAFSGASSSQTSASSGVCDTRPATVPRCTGVKMILQFAPASNFGGPLTREIEVRPQT